LADFGAILGGRRPAHSKVVVNGNVLQYARTLEVKEPSVPLNKVSDLKRL
jgi:hypothetical protein